MADNKGLDALANLGTAFGLGATDQITGKNNLGQFIDEQAKRRRQIEGSKSNSVLLSNALKTKTISQDMVPDKATYDALVALDSKDLNIWMAQSEQATARQRLDANTLADTRLEAQRLGVPLMDGDTHEDLLDRIGDHYAQENRKERARESAKDTSLAFGASIDAFAANPTEGGDENIKLEHVVATELIDSLEQTGGLTSTEADRERSLLKADLGRAQTGRDTLTASRWKEGVQSGNTADALTSLHSTDTSIGARTLIEGSSEYNSLKTQGSATLLALRTLPEGAQDRLSEGARSLHDSVVGADSADGSWELISRRNPGLAADLANPNTTPLTRELERVTAEETILKPEIESLRVSLASLPGRDIIFPGGVPKDLSEFVKLERTPDGTGFQLSGAVPSPFQTFLDGLHSLDESRTLELRGLLKTGAGSLHPLLAELEEPIERRATDIIEGKLQPVGDSIRDLQRADALVLHSMASNSLKDTTAAYHENVAERGGTPSGPLQPEFYTSRPHYSQHVYEFWNPSREYLRDSATNVASLSEVRTDNLEELRRQNSLPVAQDMLHRAQLRDQIGDTMTAVLEEVAEGAYEALGMRLDAMVGPVKDPSDPSGLPKPSTAYQARLEEIAALKDATLREQEVLNFVYDAMPLILSDAGADASPNTLATAKVLLDTWLDAAEDLEEDDEMMRVYMAGGVIGKRKLPEDSRERAAMTILLELGAPK